MTDNTHRADVSAVMGATGSGKSSALVIALAKDTGPRRIIYDPGGDFSKFGEAVSDVREALRRVVKAGAGPFHLVFNPSFDLVRARRDFSDLCELAFIAGDVLVVADEMQDVMLPNWSPAGWALLLRKGRKRGVRIIGASQRPAGIEKNIWSMATLIRSGRLNYMDDAQAVARVLMVDPYEIIALRPLHWLQRDISEPFILRGHIEFRGGQPVNVVDRKINLPAPRAP